MSPLVNNVPPRVRAFQGGLVLFCKWQRGTCKDRTTAAQLTIRGEIQLTLVSRGQAFWTSVRHSRKLTFQAS